MYNSQVPTRMTFADGARGPKEIDMKTLMPFLFALALMAMLPMDSEGAVSAKTAPPAISGQY